jgi:hypothetical protein
MTYADFIPGHCRVDGQFVASIRVGWWDRQGVIPVWRNERRWVIRAEGRSWEFTQHADPINSVEIEQLAERWPRKEAR